MGDGEKRIDPIQGEILHVYDGIEEADNELPTWWLMTFYGAIVFAIFYWIAYHELESVPLPAQEYAAALSAQSSGGEVSEALLTALVSDPSAVAAGSEIFAAQCVVCHGSQAEGDIGPNLTDPNWIYGGSPTDIYGTIYDGRLEGGMPAWGATLGAESSQRVTAYVLSVRNTNVDGKEPQGEVWTPGSGSAGDAEGDGSPAEDAEEAVEAVEEGAEAATDEDGAEEAAADEDGAEEAAADVEGATEAAVEEGTEQEAAGEDSEEESAADPESAPEAP